MVEGRNCFAVRSSLVCRFFGGVFDRLLDGLRYGRHHWLFDRLLLRGNHHAFFEIFRTRRGLWNVRGFGRSNFCRLIRWRGYIMKIFGFFLLGLVEMAINNPSRTTPQTVNNPLFELIQWTEFVYVFF